MTEPSSKQKTLTDWVNQYSDGLFSWAMYKVKNRAKAEDLIQETFLAAHEAMDNFKGDSSPKTWLSSILNRKIIDHYRRTSKLSEQFMLGDNRDGFESTEGLFNSDGRWTANGLESKWGEDENLLDNSDFNIVFDSCLKDLPAVWYTSISAKYIVQKKSKDICQDLGITTSNYWQVIHRAKLHLKKCLELKWFAKR